MIWLIIILILITIWQTTLLIKQNTSVKAFDLLLEKFIEVNQQFYEGQKNVVKKDKEMIEGLMKQISEVSILRKYSNQINMNIKNMSESVKTLKESQKTIKDSTSELSVSKDIASALATVSNNIKLLDKVVNSLKQSINELKRRK